MAEYKRTTKRRNRRKMQLGLTDKILRKRTWEKIKGECKSFQA